MVSISSSSSSSSLFLAFRLSRSFVSFGKGQNRTNRKTSATKAPTLSLPRAFVSFFSVRSILAPGSRSRIELPIRFEKTKQRVLDQWSDPLIQQQGSSGEGSRRSRSRWCRRGDEPPGTGGPPLRSNRDIQPTALWLSCRAP